ncbi:MAG TPA: gluconokinase [Candidatus Binatus sp.]|uniref:gluconokinase n=1 Tax=Candidatus Binatus sp. TaxID=2811406 RepID=UPI002B49357C|nr:gluconokinase [Candidatus Binatus sp.]HKN11823.1 gluconokinase [Candidatus Binatus sp.]
MVVIVMGVTGAGKTTIGRALAESLGWEFHDGDNLHSEASKRKMRKGIALDDGDRAPWLRAIRKLIEAMLLEGHDGVVACSALKQSYRDEIVVDPNAVKVVYLKGSKQVITERLGDRTGHFMNPDLLQSQLDTLEEPCDAIVIDVSAVPEAIVSAIRARLGR